jgi:hypothetical protein
MKVTLFTTVSIGVLAVQASLFGAAPVFTDNFNSAGSAASYTTVSSDATSSFATWAYDYSVMGIPSAPNSGDGSTRGLRLDANFSAPNAAEAITVFTTASYGGTYTVAFDAWINVNGPFPAGGSGSTCYLGAGVGANGTTQDFVANTGSGGWTAVNGENGSGIDYRLYKDASLQGVATAQYAAGTAANARNGLNGYYDQFGNVDVSNFPVQGANNGGPAQQNGTSSKGSFGMAWHRVTLDVNASGGTGGAASMKWYVDNLLIGTLDAGANGAFNANGKLAFSYSDPTSNASDNPPLSFVLIDNLQVVPEPSTAALCLIGAGALMLRRRQRK